MDQCEVRSWIEHIREMDDEDLFEAGNVIDHERDRRFIARQAAQRLEYEANRPGVLRSKLLSEQGHKCAECGLLENTEEVEFGVWQGVRLHRHRIKPGREGGKYVYGNVVLLCPRCHTNTHHPERKK
jgi:5-methylcytosine-specific restriction endonuclease McrA